MINELKKKLKDSKVLNYKNLYNKELDNIRNTDKDIEIKLISVNPDGTEKEYGKKAKKQ